MHYSKNHFKILLIEFYYSRISLIDEAMKWSITIGGLLQWGKIYIKWDKNNYCEQGRISKALTTWHSENYELQQFKAYDFLTSDLNVNVLAASLLFTLKIWGILHLQSLHSFSPKFCHFETAVVPLKAIRFKHR